MSKPSILIIEPDAFLAGIYARKFEAESWQVYVADNFKAADKIVDKKDISVIILEPDIDIKQAAGVIGSYRKKPKLSTIPILVLSGISEKEEIKRMKKAGADSYLIKGHFVPQEAVKKVKSMLVSDKT